MSIIKAPMKLIRYYDNLNFITSLRGIAIMFVFLIHSGGFGIRDYGYIGSVFVDWGKYGVMIFFVISGFTIYSQLLKRHIGFKKFILIRFLRLAIPYWPLLFLLFVFPNIYICSWSIQYPAESEILNWLLHLSFLNIFSLEYSNTIIGVEWTLGIEFFYYIVLGLFLTYMIQSNTKKIFKNTGNLLILMSFIALSGMVLGHYKIFNSLQIHWSPILYGYMFVIGGLAFIIRAQYIKKYSLKTQKYVSNIVGGVFY